MYTILGSAMIGSYHLFKRNCNLQLQFAIVKKVALSAYFRNIVMYSIYVRFTKENYLHTVQYSSSLGVNCLFV